MTRARARLVLTGAARRRVFGEYQSSEPSRFIDEVPAELVERIAPTFSGRPSRATSRTTSSAPIRTASGRGGRAREDGAGLRVRGRGSVDRPGAPAGHARAPPAVRRRQRRQRRGARRRHEARRAVRGGRRRRRCARSTRGCEPAVSHPSARSLRQRVQCDPPAVDRAGHRARTIVVLEPARRSRTRHRPRETADVLAVSLCPDVDARIDRRTSVDGPAASTRLEASTVEKLAERGVVAQAGRGEELRQRIGVLGVGDVEQPRARWRGAASDATRPRGR